MRKTFTAASIAEYAQLVSEATDGWSLDELCPWFRGHQKASWPLWPKFYRPDQTEARALDVEHEIREEFITRAPILSDIKPANEWEWYFVMQHFGAPTRLLDWTEGSLIGLYFAVRANPGFHDSAVWVLDPWWLNERCPEFAADAVPSPAAIGLPRSDDRKAGRWLPDRFSRKQLPRSSLAVYPTHLAARISSQRSCFTVHGSDRDGLQEIARLRNTRLVKIMIPAHATRKVARELQISGVDETTVFPDLEGLSRALMQKWQPNELKMPHRNVRTRLGPSRIHGVGVFAIRPIKKGQEIFPNEPDEVCWVGGDAVPKRPRQIRRLYHDFAIRKNERVGCPPNFDRLTPAWYLNEPAAKRTPNVFCDEYYSFRAVRNIRAGEELTVDYSRFNDRDSLPS